MVNETLVSASAKDEIVKVLGIEVANVTWVASREN